METRATDKPPVTNAYNSKDRNAFLFVEPQALERALMIGFLAYLLWDLAIIACSVTYSISLARVHLLANSN